MKLKTRVFDMFRSLVRVVGFDRVLRNYTRNKPYDGFICKLVPNIYQYPPGTIRTFENNGVKFEVDLHDYLGHYIYYGFFDPSQSSLFSLCREGDVILDIGTNIGFSLLNMANIVQPNGFIVGFEPDPVNFSLLKKNISLNQLSNFAVHQIGLGDRPGKFKLENVIEFNSGGKRIVPSGSSSGNFAEVEIDTLDNFLSVSQLSINKIDLIKIDVEGFEMNVLKGGINTIKRYSPVLYIELDDNNLREQTSSARDLIQFLSQLGYSIVNAETKLPVTVNDDFRNCHYDIICRKKSPTSSPT